jgi:hypothetical protein
MSYLGLIDLSGIQDYIFRSSKLSDIVEASRYIEQKLCGKTGVFRIEAEELGIRTVVVAAGNAAYVSDSKDNLKALFRRISRRLLIDGNGLEIVAHIHEYPAGALAREYQKAVDALEKNKLTAARSVPYTPPGTHVVPTEPDDANTANRRDRYDDSGLERPRELRRMFFNSSEETNLMAVVSVDGIGMGAKLAGWLREAVAYDDELFIKRFKGWSEHLVDKWGYAWAKAENDLVGAFSPADRRYTHANPADRTGRADRTIEFNDIDHRRSLPCRYIYQGGDDLSFVCDARIAMGLTVSLLRNLNEQTGGEDIPDCFRRIPASVGILFVNSHFPFSRAVSLSEELRRNAKKKALESETDNHPPSAIDWWINRQGDMAAPKRDHKPSIYAPSLTLKPYVAFRRGDPSEFTWEDLEVTIQGLWLRYGKSRNKLKDLMTAVEAGGPAEVRRILTLRPVGDHTTLDCLDAHFEIDDGFNSEETRTPLIDAGELFDIHFPYASGKPGGAS